MLQYVLHAVYLARSHGTIPDCGCNTASEWDCNAAFHVQPPCAAHAGDEVFLMNTLTDAQLVVSTDVAALLDRAAQGRVRRIRLRNRATNAKRSTCSGKTGFWSRPRRPTARRSTTISAGSRATPSELNVTVLTTLQCNFACDYCFQGDHGDYNKFADKMSLETAAARRRLDRARARSRATRKVRRSRSSAASRC